MMASGSYQIAPINNLLHVALDPGSEIELDDVRTLWSEVRRACADRGLRHVLIEAENPAGMLVPHEVVAHGELIAAGEPPALRVALCLYDHTEDDVTRAFVQSANSGPSSLQIFDELGSALRWLGA